MNQEERQNAILDYLIQNKSASYADFENIFGVSNMTIRRDIVSLASTGKVIKTVGGAQIVSASAEMYESEVLSRLSANYPEKRAITLGAVKHIQPQDVIYLDGSSTCLELAKRIVETGLSVTVVTNSLLVYSELIRNKSVTVICLGGQHDPVSYCLIGPETEAHAEKYFVNKAFISTKGFFSEHGTFESSVATYRIKQIIASNSAEVILLIDHTKFNQRSLYKVFDISRIDTIFTDGEISEKDKTALLKIKKKVVVCPVSNEQSSNGKYGNLAG